MCLGCLMVAWASLTGVRRKMKHPLPISTMAEHVPTALEAAADPADLAMIRSLYGSRAQTLLNILLAFDGYFQWYYPFKASIPFLCGMELREERALDNACRAIDMNEITERLTIRNHGSYLFHGAIFKVSRDILRVADVWATDLSKLELQNAVTKRTATAAGSRHLQLSSEGLTRKPMRGTCEGPAQLVKTKGYGTTLALSVLNNLLAAQLLRRGDGIIATPASRIKERLFGKTGRGRTTLHNLGVKIEKMGSDYEPRLDTCIKAFVRLLSARANDP